MATSVTFNGVSYSVPAVNEEDWQSLSSYLIALQNAAVSGGPVSSAVRVSALATTAVATSDYAVMINYSSGPAAVNLPAGSAGQVFFIGDASGTAATNNITINPDGANTILGGASLVLDRNSEVIGLIFSGGNWYRIGQSFPDAVSVSGSTTLNGIPAFADTDGDYLQDLGVGTANQVLVTDGTTPSWAQIVNDNVDSAAGIVYTKLNLSSSIVNSDISGSAAIEYTKLALTGQIVNADINASAGIAYSKLNLANSIQNTDVAVAANIAYSKLDLTGQLVNADVSASAAIAYSKLSLTDSIVNADINSAAAIAYSKLNLTGSVVNADINASAAIARSKIASGTASHVVVNDGAGALSSVAVLPVSQGGTGLSTLGSALQVLRVDSLGTSLEFATLAPGTGDVVGPSSSVTNGIVQFASTTGKALKDLGVGSANQVLLTDGTAPSFGSVTNDYIDVNAGIALTKLAATTASRALATDVSGFIVASAVTSTELGYLSGVTSGVQSQIDSKTGIADNETITGTWTFNNIITGDISGNAGTVTNGVYTNGAQTIAGVKTFNSTIVGDISGNAGTVTNGAYVNAANTFTLAQTITAASNQLVLSSGVNQLTLNSGTSAAARTYTVPDVGTSADFVMTAGAQTIAGAKTFTSTLDIQFGGSSLVIGADLGASTRTGGARKYAYISVPHATTVEENVLLAQVETDTNFNVVRYGGGDGNYNALTEHRWYTAASAAIVTGTERMRLTSSGNVSIGTPSPVANAKLHLSAAGDSALLLEDSSQASGSRNWSITNSATILNFLARTDAGTGGVNALQLARTGAVTLGPSGGGVNHIFNGGNVHTVTTDSSTGTANSFVATNRRIIQWTGGSALTLNGFTGGVTGQIISFVTASSSTVTVNHNNAGGTQKIFTTTAGAMTFTAGEAFSAYFDGTQWRMINSST